MVTPRLALYHDSLWISPYVFSAFVALREKGLAFETREIKLQSAEQRAPEYAARSITARLPSLEHDGFTVAESSAIVEYLEDAFRAPRLLPADVRERARARQLMSWLRSDDTAPLRQARPTSSMFYERTGTPLGEGATRAAAKLVAVAERVVVGAHMFGAWCMADADLAFMLQRLNLNGDPLPERLRAYADAQWTRPSVHAFASIARPPYVPYG
jgi:glutathione S-transferase